MKSIIIDFVWSGDEYGHREVKKSNGRTTKYYKNGKEIPVDEFTSVAEKHAKAFNYMV